MLLAFEIKIKIKTKLIFSLNLIKNFVIAEQKTFEIRMY